MKAGEASRSETLYSVKRCRALFLGISFSVHLLVSFLVFLDSNGIEHVWRTGGSPVLMRCWSGLSSEAGICLGGYPCLGGPLQPEKQYQTHL